MIGLNIYNVTTHFLARMLVHKSFGSVLTLKPFLSVLTAFKELLGMRIEFFLLSLEVKFTIKILL